MCLLKFWKKFKTFGILKKSKYSKKIKNHNFQKYKKLELIDIGIARNATETNFCLSHEKCFFYFQSAENGFCYEAAIEIRNRKLGTTHHINYKPPWIHISAFVLLRYPRMYILDFAQALADFARIRVSLHFSGNKRSSCIFCKIIFESTTHHFFTKF
jgi:hypothetical protein